jgi:cobalt-zinc-cadmium efflux system protein
LGSHNHHGHQHHDHAGHGHDNDHSRGGHVHAPANFGKAFAIGIMLNTALVVAEAIYGYIGNSTALLADAGHNLSDVLGLVVAWGASIAARRAPSGRFTYGFRASTILAALANAVFLLVPSQASP